MAAEQPEPAEPDTPVPADAASVEPEWRRRRRLAEVFGDSLPEQVSDPGEASHTPRGREWYEQNRPPHYE